MSDKFFLDTNIFVYSFDTHAKHKQIRSADLIKEALVRRQGITSSQVVQEFVNVATRKFAVPMHTADALDYLRTVLFPLCEVFPSPSLYETALHVMEDARLGWYDALVIAAAASAECATMYSEDLQSGQVIHGVKICNPFR